MFEVKLKFNVDFTGGTIVVPVVCVGNVAQLAVDLLLNSTESEKIGYIYTSYLYSFVGTEALSGGKDRSLGNLSTSCEIFRCTGSSTFIIQQRSPIINGCGKDFRFHLKDWIKRSGFKSVVILTGSFAHFRSDAELAESSLCRFLSSSTDDNFVCELGWKSFQLVELTEEEKCFKSAPIPGGGIAHTLFKEFLEDGIKTVICLIFCSEGNNIPEAVQLASYVNQWTKLNLKAVKTGETANWTKPVSWSFMFGREAARTIF
ncbi:Proteasome assembly chaperone 2 [Chamberlinius hualienensis]